MELTENKEKLKEFRERAEKLVALMTLEEKVGQTLYNAPAIERLGIRAYNWWNEALHGAARAGIATVFPRPSVLRQPLTRILSNGSRTPSPRKHAPSSICSRQRTIRTFIRG